MELNEVNGAEAIAVLGRSDLSAPDIKSGSLHDNFIILWIKNMNALSLSQTHLLFCEWQKVESLWLDMFYFNKQNLRIFVIFLS